MLHNEVLSKSNSWFLRMSRFCKLLMDGRRTAHQTPHKCTARDYIISKSQSDSTTFTRRSRKKLPQTDVKFRKRKMCVFVIFYFYVPLIKRLFNKHTSCTVQLNTRWSYVPNILALDIAVNDKKIFKHFLFGCQPRGFLFTMLHIKYLSSLACGLGEDHV